MIPDLCSTARHTTVSIMPSKRERYADDDEYTGLLFKRGSGIRRVRGLPAETTRKGRGEQEWPIDTTHHDPKRLCKRVKEET